jgi:transcriptional regulator with XRE-family HTH domain
MTKRPRKYRHKPRGEMTPEELERARARDRAKAKARAMGKPYRVKPHELKIARDIVVDCHSRGMTFDAMEQQLGVGRHTLGHLARGVKQTLERDIYDAILMLEFRPPSKGRRTGARLDSTGTVRRVDALRVMGYPKHFLADYLGVQHQNMPCSPDPRKSVYPDLAQQVREMYDKLKDADPADFVTGAGVARALTAVRKISPPPIPGHCWDEDTIDDPDALPEWTGACGTEYGYRIHLREVMGGKPGLLPCLPCRDAAERCRGVDAGPLPFHRQRFVELIKERGTSVRATALRAGLDEQSVFRWKKGDYAPKFFSDIESLASALDCDVSELLDGERREPDWSVPLLEAGQFNRHRVRVMLDIARITQSKAADIIGASRTSMNNWMFGRSKPSEPARLAKLAEILGVNPEVFYQ